MPHVLHVLMGFLVTTAICFSLSLLSSRLVPLISRSDLNARQTAHLRPTLRLGGMGILAGVWVVALIQQDPLLLTLLSCSLPVFLIGLLEDIGHLQSPRRRLLVAAASSVAVMIVTGTYIQNGGNPVLDYLLALPALGMLFTVFATVGLIHAFNLIDGVNGLGGAVALIGSIGLAAIGYRAGVEIIELPVAALAGAMLGFLVLNYPLGRIFLGDAGAYTVGFLLAWMAVFLLAAVPTVSHWALVLLFFWPIADTLLAILRRILLRAPIGAPDRLHAHHVAMRIIEIVVLQRKDRRFSNPMTTLVAVPFMLPPALAAILLWNDPIGSGVALLGFGLLFVASYRFVIIRARNLRASAKVSRTRKALIVPGDRNKKVAEAKLSEVKT